jgi:hypothetical protein
VGDTGNIGRVFNKIKEYVKRYSRYGIWWHPKQRIASHNIKVLFILFRFLFGLTILVLSFKYQVLFPILVILFLVYLIWAYRKIFVEFGDWRIDTCCLVLQTDSDFAVMPGFLYGILD